MKKNNKQPKYMKFVISGFIVFGAIFILLGIVLGISDINFKKTAIETTATITNIYSHTNSDGDTDHTVYVEYTIDGVKYNEQLDIYKTNMQEGQSVQILYSPQNPQKISAVSSGTFFFMIPFGAIFFLIGFIPIVRQRKKEKFRKFMLANGRMIMATITDIKWGNDSGNSSYVYNVFCEYEDELKKEIYTFKSENIWSQSRPAIEEGEKKTIPVYVDGDDYSKYYVDIESFLEKV